MAPETPVQVIKIGEKEFPLVNHGVPIVYADLIVEVRVQAGNVYLSLASSSVDGRNTPMAEMCSRVRMPARLWDSLRSAMDRIVAESETKTPRKRKAN